MAQESTMTRRELALASVFALAISILPASRAEAQSRANNHAVVVATMLEALPSRVPACGYFYVLSARRFRIERVESGTLTEHEPVLVLRCPGGSWQVGRRYRLTLSRERPPGVAGVYWAPRPPRGVATWWVLDQRPDTP